MGKSWSLSQTVSQSIRLIRKIGCRYHAVDEAKPKRFRRIVGIGQHRDLHGFAQANKARKRP